MYFTNLKSAVIKALDLQLNLWELRILALLNKGMKFYVLKSKTPYPLCASAPLREKNHPAIIKHQNF